LQTYRHLKLLSDNLARSAINKNQNLQKFERIRGHESDSFSSILVYLRIPSSALSTYFLLSHFVLLLRKAVSSFPFIHSSSSFLVPSISNLSQSSSSARSVSIHHRFSLSVLSTLRSSPSPAPAAMAPLKLTSSDNESFSVDTDIIRTCSKTIRTMLDDLGDDEGDDPVPIPLPNVTAAILEKVIEWATHHKVFISLVIH